MVARERARSRAGPALSLGPLTGAAAGVTAQALESPVPELGVRAVLAGGTLGI